MSAITNLTRENGKQLFDFLAETTVETIIHPYSLKKANEALRDLKQSKYSGSAVIMII